MAEFNGSTTTTGTTEINLFDVTAGGPKYFTTHVYMHNLTATETIQFFVYLYDANASTYRLAWGPADGLEFTGVQDPAAHYLPTVVSKQFKVSMKMTAGTDKAITWYRYEQQA